MQTASFFRFYKRQDQRLVSIARTAPEWFEGRQYQPLVPRHRMFGLSEDEFKTAYMEYLETLDPQKVWADLGEDAILLCWEGSDKFCHRRLVAEWIEQKLGERVEEVPWNRTKSKPRPQQLPLFS